jgi:hypothetical protein
MPNGAAGTAMKELRAVALMLMPILVLSCSQETGHNAQTEEQRSCISRLYPNYNVRQLEQCMRACKSCMGGNTVTCSTSCKLKSAS